VIRLLYSIATWLAQPLLRRKLARLARSEPGYARDVPERFGIYTHSPTQVDVWVHAVSLGETRVAGLLLTELRARCPQLRLLLTHGTATGRAEGAKLLRPGDLQVWQPWDTQQAVGRFLTHFKPRLGILLETEVWPNLAALCQRSGVPLVLVNARLNAHSAAKAQKMSWLARPAYAALAGAWAQTELDAQRLRAVGARVRGVTGNIKFDINPDSQQLQQGRRWRDRRSRPVLLLAISREGEELLWLNAVRANPVAQTWQWLIVPRHPQRFDAVAQLIEQAGLTLSRRSQWQDGPDSAQVWLGDSLGEMPTYYGLSDLALLGGSFEPLGGQNLIEAAACECPLLIGPHTFNFSQAAELAITAGAAQRCTDMTHALVLAQAWLDDPTALAQARAAALRFASSRQGAARQTVQGLAPWLPPLLPLADASQ